VVSPCHGRLWFYHTKNLEYSYILMLTSNCMCRPYIDTNNPQGMQLDRFKNRTPARFDYIHCTLFPLCHFLHNWIQEMLYKRNYILLSHLNKQTNKTKWPTLLHDRHIILQIFSWTDVTTYYMCRINIKIILSVT
jgi:hypothetical protein